MSLSIESSQSSTLRPEFTVSSAVSAGGFDAALLKATEQVQSIPPAKPSMPDRSGRSEESQREARNSTAGEASSQERSATGKETEPTQAGQKTDGKASKEADTDTNKDNEDTQELVVDGASEEVITSELVQGEAVAIEAPVMAAMSALPGQKQPLAEGISQANQMAGKDLPVAALRGQTGEPLMQEQEGLSDLLGDALGVEESGLGSDELLMADQKMSKSAVEIAKPLTLELPRLSNNVLTQTVPTAAPQAQAPAPVQNLTSLTKPNALSVAAQLPVKPNAGAVGERVLVMAAGNIKSAEIQLDPPELGQLQVRVTLNQDQAAVSFTVQNAQAREQLEQSSAKLREMFEQEGMDLVDVDVSDGQQQSDSHETSAGDGLTGAGLEGDESDVSPTLVRASDSLVDYFA